MARDLTSRVLDALFTVEVRRRFSARIPGDWNIPLADADADALCQVTSDIFCVPSVGLTGAVAEKRRGYATWSFFPPQSEALVADLCGR
jgi:raffinose/stachyose/melibiose transport system substrate-binding protein